jgi:hypothetical protein
LETDPVVTEKWIKNFFQPDKNFERKWLRTAFKKGIITGETRRNEMQNKKLFSLTKNLLTTIRIGGIM